MREKSFFFKILIVWKCEWDARRRHLFTLCADQPVSGPAATVSPLAGEASPLPPRGSSSFKCLLLKHLPFFARLSKIIMEGLKAHRIQWLSCEKKEGNWRESEFAKLYRQWLSILALNGHKFAVVTLSVIQQAIDSNRRDALGVSPGCDGCLSVQQSFL